MTSIFPAELLPSTARVNCGQLELGGLSASQLVEQYGSPLLVYDERHLRERSAEIRAAFPDGASYATKAFLCRSIARLVYEEGLGLDVASGGEMAVALDAGVPGNALTLHGNNKSLTELEMALNAGVGRIVADSDDELDRLESRADGMSVPPLVLIRVNPAVTAQTHRSIRTGHSNSKFGVTLEGGRAEALVNRVRRSKKIRFGGVHMHVGSQITDLEPLSRAIRIVAAFAEEVGAEELIVGGGLGVRYRAGDYAPSVAEWGSAVRNSATAGGFGGLLTAEPGRVLTATAGVTLYTIGTVKNGSRTRFLAVDGGISDNPRPALYQASFQPILVRHPFIAADAGPFTVVGKNCESSDTFASDVFIPGDPQVGDLLCLPVTGAYCYSMSSHYNGLFRPAIVMVNGGQSRIVTRRETVEDLLRLDLIA